MITKEELLKLRFDSPDLDLNLRVLRCLKGLGRETFGDLRPEDRRVLIIENHLSKYCENIDYLMWYYNIPWGTAEDIIYTKKWRDSYCKFCEDLEKLTQELEESDKNV